MRICVIIIVSTFCNLIVTGNSNPVYTLSKQGITIICGGSDDSLKSKKDLNDFLDFLISKIKRADNQIKIVIQTTFWGFERARGDNRKEFIFVSYDTLLKGDTIYLEKSDMLRNQQIYNLPASQTWMYYQSASEIDNFYTKDDVGLKIKYVGYDPDMMFFDRLIRIVNFALANIPKIKAAQRYYPVEYFMETGMNLSLLSFDTALLNKIPQKKLRF